MQLQKVWTLTSILLGTNALFWLVCVISLKYSLITQLALGGYMVGRQGRKLSLLVVSIVFKKNIYYYYYYVVQCISLLDFLLL